MAESKHLTYFKVENFKCFESFEMDDIGQFNLIVGDNNVGKTTTLEALLFDENLQDLIHRLSFALDQRFNDSFDFEETDYNFLKHYKNSNSKTDAIKYTVKFTNEISGTFNLAINSVNEFNLNDAKYSNLTNRLIIKKNLKNLAVLKRNEDIFDIKLLNDESDYSYSPIIYYSQGYGRDLVEFYSENIQKSKSLKNEFINNLRSFIDLIEDIEISSFFPDSNQSLFIRVAGIDQIMPLSMFGDGANKLVRILLEIEYSKGKKMLVDEIDTGIHYSRFKQFWKTILESSMKNEVQLFATTHNLECLNYFKEALEELGGDFIQKSRLFHLTRIKDKTIKSYNYRFPQFSSNLELENEMR